jgi:hypothetical protein
MVQPREHGPRDDTTGPLLSRSLLLVLAVLPAGEVIIRLLVADERAELLPTFMVFTLGAIALGLLTTLRRASNHAVAPVWLTFAATLPPAVVFVIVRADVHALAAFDRREPALRDIMRVGMLCYGATTAAMPRPLRKTGFVLLSGMGWILASSAVLAARLDKSWGEQLAFFVNLAVPLALGFTIIDQWHRLQELQCSSSSRQQDLRARLVESELRVAEVERRYHKALEKQLCEVALSELHAGEFERARRKALEKQLHELALSEMRASGELEETDFPDNAPKPPANINGAERMRTRSEVGCSSSESADDVDGSRDGRHSHYTAKLSQRASPVIGPATTVQQPPDLGPEMSAELGRELSTEM